MRVHFFIINPPGAVKYACCSITNKNRPVLNDNNLNELNACISHTTILMFDTFVDYM